MNVMYAMVLQATLMSATDETYARAYKEAESGKPLVVLIGADWCPGCRTMKNSVMPQVRQSGALQKVAFVSVNTDYDRELANKMMNAGSIPQLIIYHKTGESWNREVVVGARSAADVERMIDRAVAATKAAPTTPANTVAGN